MLIIRIVNTGTGNERYGDYRYTVSINGEVMEDAQIAAHDRNRGWRQLIQDLAKKVGNDER